MPIVRQVGVLPIRTRDRRVETLLITSSSSRWIVPKGRISRRLKLWETAAKEAYEEAGVTGLISRRPVGEFTMTTSSAVKRRIVVYVLQVERQFQDWPERHRRERMWVPLSKACDVVAERSLAGLILSLALDPSKMRSESRTAEYV